MNISLQVQPALHPLVRRLLVLVEDVEYLPIVVSSLLGSSFDDGSHRGLLLFYTGALLKLAVDLLSKRCERSGRLFVVHRRWCWLVVGRLRSWRIGVGGGSG